MSDPFCLCACTNQEPDLTLRKLSIKNKEAWKRKCLAKQSFFVICILSIFYNMSKRISDILPTSPMKEVQVYTNDKQTLTAKQQKLKNTELLVVAEITNFLK